MNESEIEKMVKDAAAHAEEDRRAKEKIEARNQLDTLIYQVEKDTKEWGDKITGDGKTKLDSAIERGKKALKQDDVNELNAAREELMGAFSAAGQQFYQAQAAQQQQAQPGAQPEEPAAEPAGAGARSGGRPDDVVEADYEIVDDNK